jgi:formate C-acetyltransferase
MVQVYKEYADYSPAILRARFFERLMDNKKIYIDDNLFVGSIAGEPGAFYVYPEWDPSWLKDDNKFEIPEGKKALLDEVGKYWEKRCLAYQTAETVKNIYGKDLHESIVAGQFTDLTAAPSGVSNSNYERVIKEGLGSVIKEAEENYKKLDVTLDNKDKFDFYQGVIIESKAIIRYAKRYAELAKLLAENEENETRKQEYLDIVEICTYVPENPARNFREAIQSHFFAHLASELEQVGCGVSQGYLGQVLEPFYQKDKKEGILNEEQATYILKHFFLKLNDISYYYGQRMDVSNSGDTAQTINIGGYTEDGRDATAELDYLILDAQKD